MAGFASGENAALVTNPISAPPARSFVPDGWRSNRRKLQPYALPIDVPARPHALDDFLPRVAALVEADVRAFERGFVRNHSIVEIGREPGHPGFETQRVQCSHPDGFAAMRANTCQQLSPERRKTIPPSDELRSCLAEMRVPNHLARNVFDRHISNGHFSHIFELYAASLLDNHRCARTFD